MMNATGWQPLTGWAAVGFAALIAAYTAFWSAPEQCGERSRTRLWLRVTLGVAGTAVLVWLAVWHQYSYVYFVLGLYNAGNFAQHLRRSMPDRLQIVSDLGLALGFFAFGTSEVLHSDVLFLVAAAVAIASIALMFVKRRPALLERNQR